MLFVILDGIYAVKRERRKEGISYYSLSHPGYGRSYFISKEMASQAWFCSLSIFEFYYPDSLNGFFPYSEETSSDLGDYVFIIWFEMVRISPFAGTGKGIPRHGRTGSGEHR
jgi:hypothetical protein